MSEEKTLKYSKVVLQEGNDNVEDPMPADSIWLGKKRNIIFEFLFKLDKEGEVTENEDKEDPEEFILYETEAENPNKR
jgi:hypothetical protein